VGATKDQRVGAVLQCGSDHLFDTPFV
jgi:hypothetical protein